MTVSSGTRYQRLRARRHALAAGIFMLAAAMQSAGQNDSSLSAPRALHEFRQFADDLQTAIAEYHVAQMRYPASLEELPPIPPLPPSIGSVRVGRTGASNIPATIALELAARDLGGHRIYLLLRVDSGPSYWQCVSTDIASVATLVPGCTYAPGYNPPATEEVPLQPRWQALYTGSLGGVPVVAQFWQSTQTTSTKRDSAVPIEGLYYYRRHPRDLSLRQLPGQDTLHECPGSFDSSEGYPQPTGIWHVNVTEERVIGTWQASPNVSPNSVALARRVTGKRLAHDVYYDLQHEDERRSVAVEAKRHGIAWKTERRRYDIGSLTGRIVLLDSPVPGARERINRWLRNNIHYPDSAAECAHHTESCDDGQDVDVLFANERMFAVGGMSYSSGGAHPTNGFDATTFDLRSGREIDWTQIVLVNDTSAAGGSPVDLRRRDLLASYVLRAAMSKDGCVSAVAARYGCAGDVCANGPDPDDRTWSLYPTLDGLAVASDVYSEAERGCRGESIIVPWRDVRQTLRRPMILP